MVTILVGAVVGVVARDRFGIAMAAFIGFAALAALAALDDPKVSLGLAVIPAGLAAISGLVALQWLYARGAEPAGPPSDGASAARTSHDVASSLGREHSLGWRCSPVASGGRW